MKATVPALDLLQEGAVVGVADRHAHIAGDLAAGRGEGLLELGFGVLPGAEVGHQREDILNAVLGSPAGDRRGVLRQGHRGAHEVVRLGRDRRRGGVHHHHRLLGLGGHRRDREGRRREREASQDVHLVLDDQLLRQALADVASGAGAVVLDDQLDLAPAEGVAVGGQVELDAVLDLLAVRGEWPRHRQHQPDLDGFSRPCIGADGGRQRKADE
jgi:hypothetical protein